MQLALDRGATNGAVNPPALPHAAKKCHRIFTVRGLGVVKHAK